MLCVGFNGLCSAFNKLRSWIYCQEFQPGQFFIAASETEEDATERELVRLALQAIEFFLRH
jgi:hypothetical protein